MRRSDQLCLTKPSGTPSLTTIAMLFGVICFAASDGQRSEASALVQETANEAPSNPQLSNPKLGPGAVSPAAAVYEAYFSILSGELTRIENVADKREGAAWESLKASIAFGNAANQFRDNFISTYGLKKWENFNDPNHIPLGRTENPGNANGNLTVMKVTEVLTAVHEATNNRNGDKSYASLPGFDGQQLSLVQKNGRWYFRLDTFGAPMEDPKHLEVAEMLNKIVPRISDIGIAIGAKGVQADDIDVEMARMVLRELNGVNLPDAPRFDFAKVQTTGAPQRAAMQKAIDDKKAAVRNLATTIIPDALAGKMDSYLDKLHPDLKVGFDSDRLKNQLAAIQKRLAGARFDPDAIEYIWHESAKNNFRLVASLETQEELAIIQLFVIDGSVVGLQVEHGKFSIDTRNLHNDLGDQETTNELLTLLYSQQDKAAFSKMPDAVRVKGFDAFKSDFEWPLKAKFTAATIHSAAIRVQWPPNNEGAPSVVREVLVQLEPSGENNKAIKRDRCDCNFFLRNGQWELAAVVPSGSDGSNVSELSDNAVTFLRALSQGNAKKCASLFPPQSLQEIDMAVFTPYCQWMSKIVGEYQSVDQSKSDFRATNENGFQKSTYQGLVHFKNTSVRWKSKWSLDFITNFTFSDLPTSQIPWQKNITNTDGFRDRGEKMLRAVLAGEMEDAVNLLDSGFRNDLVDDNGELNQQAVAMKDHVAKLTAGLGAIQSAQMTSKTFLDEKNQWRFNYVFQYESEAFVGHADFDFNALQGTILSFNLHRQSADENKPDK